MPVDGVGDVNAGAGNVPEFVKRTENNNTINEYKRVEKVRRDNLEKGKIEESDKRLDIANDSRTRKEDVREKKQDIDRTRDLERQDRENERQGNKGDNFINVIA